MFEYYYLLIILIIVIVLLIALYIVKKIQNYIEEEYFNLIENTNLYFQELDLLDGKYLEKIDKHGASVIYSLKSNKEFDYISGIELKKHYRFLLDRVVYIFNDNWKEKPRIILINNKEYYEIDESITKIHILVSFEKSHHILAKYLVKKIDQELVLVIDEEGEDLDEEK
jgi:hypothetical protein